VVEMTADGSRTRGARRSVRQRLVATIAVTGVGALSVMALLMSHEQHWFLLGHYQFFFRDLLGRLANLNNLRATGNIYVPFGVQAFTYPPGAIFFFWPLLWLPSQHVILVWTTVSVAALAATIGVTVHFMFRPSRAVTVAVATWATVASISLVQPVTECLLWGQLGLVLTLFVVLDELAVRGPERGVLIGVATAVKIYPGIFIVAMLLRRQWRPAITASATTALLTGAAWVYWPASGSSFFRDVLLGGKEWKKLAGGATAFASSSLNAMFMRPPFHVGFLNSSEVLALDALVVVAALISAQRAWGQGLRVSPLVVLLIASVVAAPVAWDHYFAFAPLYLLVAWEAGPTSALGWASTSATVVSIFPWFYFRNGPALSWWASTYMCVARNALLWSALAVLITSFWVKASPRAMGTLRADADVAATEV
jgi:alpha-1,2-mannosyltransferase